MRRTALVLAACSIVNFRYNADSIFNPVACIKSLKCAYNARFQEGSDFRNPAHCRAFSDVY